MKLLQVRSWFAPVLLFSLTFLIIFLTDRFVLTAGFYSNSGQRFSLNPGNSSNALEDMQKWVYLSSAAYLLLKLSVISLILHTALYLYNEDVPFGVVFRVVIYSEYIFLIPATVKLLTFNRLFEQGTLLDWHRYSVLSALSVLDHVPPDWYYPLQTVNVFEVAYCCLLAFGLQRISSLNFSRSLKLVLCSYVPALLIWVAAVTFITLLLFPSTG